MEEPLSQEIIAKLEALPAPIVPCGRLFSPFIQKFRLLPPMDPRRLETEEVGLSRLNTTFLMSEKMRHGLLKLMLLMHNKSSRR